MKATLPIAFFLLMIALQLKGQHADSLREKSARNDAGLTRAKMNSIGSDFNKEADSLTITYKKQISQIDTVRSSIQHRIDSLAGLQLPAEKLTHKLDSLNAEREKSISSFNQKMSDVRQQATGKLAELQVPPELEKELDAVTKHIDEFQPKISNDVTGHFDVSGLKDYNALTTSLPSGIDDVGNMDGLKNLNTNVDGLSDITKEAGGYQQDLRSIGTGNLDEVKQLPAAVEDKAGNLSGIKDLQSQSTEAVAPIQDLNTKIQNPDAAKEEMLQKAQEVAIDHFAGKEEVLQQAMDKMSKYKQKYPSVNSLSDITKKRPNEMRGKPLIERLLPGMAMQIQKKGSDLFIDFNPYVGYRLTRRITAGLGWNQRVPFNDPSPNTRKQVIVYGPRMFGEYRLPKGVYPRLEIECLNTNVPVALSKQIHDPSTREWVLSYVAGIKKDYRIYKSIKGTALILFNLYDPRNRSPYPDRVITRFGFEFPMKHKSSRVKK